MGGETNYKLTKMLSTFGWEAVMMSFRIGTIAIVLLLGVTQSIAQDFNGFDPKKCSPVNAADQKAIAWNANWCRSGGATLTINQQANNGYCKQYTFSYGNAHQHELLRLAVTRAKKNEYQDAVSMIAACQCHNPPIHDLSYAQARELICWLRTQKY